MGSNFFLDCNVLLQYQSKPIIAFEVKDDNLFINLNYYDETGRLVFWMRRNLYWCDERFEVTIAKDKLVVKNNETSILSMLKNGDFFDINGVWNLNGRKLIFSPTETTSEGIRWWTAFTGLNEIKSLIIKGNVHNCFGTEPIFNIDPVT